MGAYGKKHNISHFSLVVDICTFAFYTLRLVNRSFRGETLFLLKNYVELNVSSSAEKH